MPKNLSTNQSEEYWKKKLSPEQFEVLRKKGTERAFVGKYVHSKENGMYTCAGCGAELFSSTAKFDSGTGWPSFSAPAVKENITTKEDVSHGMHRIEVLCRHCGGHLRHVFPDGPGPSGMRFCINSCSLGFKKKSE